MVFQDISQSVDLNSLRQKKSTAHLMDRFFSFVIDYVVISPFVFFLLYTSFSNGFNFWKTHPSAPENDLFILIITLCFVFYFSLIQSLFIVYLKATPGQYFLKIKIEFSGSSAPLFFKSMFRQISFWGSFAFLGIPFLSILTHKNRTTFYDRLSEAQVVSYKEDDQAFFDFEREYKYWQSFASTLVVFVFFLFGIFIWQNYNKVVERTASFAALDEQEYFCDEMADADVSERLPVAVALNLIGQLSDSCLNKEADFTLWGDKTSDYSLAYFAKYLTTEDFEKEQKYLAKSCEKVRVSAFDSEICAIAEAFKNKNFQSLYSHLRNEGILADVLKYELSRALNKNTDIEQNFKNLSKYEYLKPLRKYQAIELLSARSKDSRAPAAVSTEDNSELIKIIKGL